MFSTRYRGYIECFRVGHQLWLMLRLGPTFAKHYYRRPYRRGDRYELTGDENRRGKREALYDTLFDMLLAGYRELSGRTIRPDTGSMFFLLRRLARAHDDEFERRSIAGESLQHDAIRRAPSVEFCRERLRRFVEPRSDFDRMITHLRELFEQHYDEHLQRWQSGREVAADAEPNRDPGGVTDQNDGDQNDGDQRHGDHDYGDQGHGDHGDGDALGKVRAVIELDSGLWLTALLDCVALYNDHPLDGSWREEFHHLGIAGKMTNDMIDVGYDHIEGLPNYMMGVLRRYPSEMDRAIDHGPDVGSAGLDWWRSNCPRAVFEFFADLQSRYDRLSSKSLRRCCDAMTWPVIYGRDYKRRSHQPDHRTSA